MIIYVIGSHIRSWDFYESLMLAGSHSIQLMTISWQKPKKDEQKLITGHSANRQTGGRVEGILKQMIRFII